MAISIFGKKLNIETESLTSHLLTAFEFYVKHIAQNKEPMKVLNKESEGMEKCILLADLNTKEFFVKEYTEAVFETDGLVPILARFQDEDDPDAPKRQISFIPSSHIFSMKRMFDSSESETLELFMQELENLRFQYKNDDAEHETDAKINIGVYPNVRDYLTKFTDIGGEITDGKYIDRTNMKSHLDDIYTILACTHVKRIRLGAGDSRRVDCLNLDKEQSISYNRESHHMITNPIKGAV